MKNTITYIGLGIFDSLQVKESVSRYLSPDVQEPLYITLIRILTKKYQDNEHSKLIAGTTSNIFWKATKFLFIVLILGIIRDILIEYIGFISSTIYWVIVGCMFLECALQMWVYQQEIGQEVINMELQFYGNEAFVEYQIATQEESTLSLIHLQFSRLLFNLLFQLQTNIIGFFIDKLTWPYNYILRIPVFALFISVSNTSAKISFSEHLPYYFDQHLAYLVGLNIVQSSLLHFSKFPFFTGLLWIVQPILILNSISKEPPRLEYIPDEKSKQDKLVINRDTYKNHLKQFISSNEYKLKCSSHIGYMSLPAILTPLVQNIINQLLKTLGQSSDEIEKREDIIKNSDGDKKID